MVKIININYSYLFNSTVKQLSCTVGYIMMRVLLFCFRLLYVALGFERV